MLIKKGRGWNLPESRVISESRYFDRRAIVKALGLGSVGAVTGPYLVGCLNEETLKNPVELAPAFVPDVPDDIADLYPAPPNPNWDEVPPGRQMTPEDIAGTYNNFYEFGTDKTKVHVYAQSLVTRPWAVEIAGRCHNPGVIDVDKFYQLFDLEERIYRHRCVEAWSMVVPWTGFSLRSLIEYADPMMDAHYVAFTTFYRPDQAIGQQTLTQYDWPYYEALRIDEVVNEVAFAGLGIFGHIMPPQHGAPFRLIIPWKYGYKSIKSIVRIEFFEDRPPTFWNDRNAEEYSWLSNVDPNVPHPRWSQATERDIGTEEQIPTLKYNGYGDWVAGLYE